MVKKSNWLKTPRMHDLTKYYFSKVKYPLKKNERCCEFKKIVYVIYNPITKLTKIGITGDFNNRLRSLSNSSGVKLITFGYIILQEDYDESANLIEHHIHAFFKKKRVLGEWFNLSIKDLVQIRELIWKIEGECIDESYRKYLLNQTYAPTTTTPH